MEIRRSTALITGGASGLGAATARALHQRGARVVLCDIREDVGRACAEELGEGALFAHLIFSLTNLISEGRSCMPI